MPGNDTPIRDVIAADLRRRIVLGEIKPGERVREEEIALTHGMSRVPVREALRRLEAEGYVELTPHRGARVLVTSSATALELMQVRRPLEVLAARLAAQQSGGAVAPALRRVTASGLRAASRSERKRHPTLVDEFHDLVSQASGNAQLVELLAQLRSKVRWVFAADLEDRATIAWQAHEAVLDAILSGDEDKAAQLMDEHVAADESWYLSKLAEVSSRAES